jgi:hypothetical protein
MRPPQRTAAEADREPAKPFADRFVDGAAQVVVALRALLRDPALRRAALLPTLLSVSGAAGLAALGVWWDWGEEGAGWHWAARRFFAVFLALAAMPPTLLHPLWGHLAAASRRSLGLATSDAPHVSYLRMLINETKKAIRQAIIGGTIGLLPVLIVVGVLPGSGVISPILIAAWAIYWIQLDAFELPFELADVPPPRRSPWFARWAHGYGTAGKWWSFRFARKIGRWLHRLSRPWRREIAFTERNAAACLGFGLALAVIFFVPVLGLIFRPLAIIAATHLAAREPDFARASA